MYRIVIAQGICQSRINLFYKLRLNLFTLVQWKVTNGRVSEGRRARHAAYTSSSSFGRLIAIFLSRKASYDLCKGTKSFNLVPLKWHAHQEP